MSIVSYATNPFGPATLNLQIEQGADFSLAMHLQKGDPLADWDLTGATFDAHLSPTWAPGQSAIAFQVNVVSAPGGTLTMSLAKAVMASFVPTMPPKKTIDQQPIELGGWVFNITQNGVTQRLFDGFVQLDKDPAVT